MSSWAPDPKQASAYVVRNSIANYFRNKLPPLISTANTVWGTNIPQIGEVLPYAPPVLKHREKPLIGVVVGGANSFKFRDTDEHGQTVMDVVYPTKLFLWCFTPELPAHTDPNFDNTIRVTEETRDRLAVLIRTLIFNDDGFGAEYMRASWETLKEHYSETVPVPNVSGRMVAAASFDIQITAVETYFIAPLGVVESTNIETGALDQ